jgi:hypothetical protein
MKIKVLLFTTIAAFCLLSCSSPESDGASLANKLNKCNASFVENAQQVESRFVAGFNEAGFQTRSEAKQAYSDVLNEAFSKYQIALAKVYDQEAEMAKKYSNDYKKKAEFDNALRSGIDRDLEDRIMALSTVSEIPEPVMAQIRTIVPPKPDYLQIQNDLVGRSLSEGVDEGYYSSNWKWTIKSGEISGFSIESVLSDTPHDYILIANMRLTSSVGKAFDVKAKIRYILPQNDDWTLEFVQSLGMYIVKTGVYNDSIKSYVGNGSWDHPFCLENNCEIALEVGGKILEHGKWTKFSKVVNAHSFTTVGWSVDDGRVDYVEIP